MKRIIGIFCIGLCCIALGYWLIAIGFWGYHTFQWNTGLNGGFAFGPHYDQNQIWFPRLLIGYVGFMVSLIPLGIGLTLIQED